MKKFLKNLLPLTLLPLATPLSAAPLSKLKSFDKLELGALYSTLIAKQAACDSPRDTPDFRESLSQGVSSTVCPTKETFAMATLLHDKVASVAVNWISWDAKKLVDLDPSLAKIAADLRQQYGIPTSTIAYESQFGNPEADEFCGSGEFTCQMHIWQSTSPDRVANLIYAKNAKGEVPLLFNLSDLESISKIEAIKNRRLQASINAAKKDLRDTH